MPHGLEVYSATGAKLFGPDSRIARGSVATRITNDGSMSVPVFSTGTPFAIFIADALTFVGRHPEITLVGTTITWTYPATPAHYPRMPGLIVCGAY